MNEEHPVSRRASLKSLGAVGAAIMLGGAAPTSHQADPKAQGDAKPAQGDKEKPAANVVDVAVGRMAKGHS